MTRDTHHNGRRRRRGLLGFLAILLAFSLIAAACGDDDDDTASDDDGSSDDGSSGDDGSSDDGSSGDDGSSDDGSSGDDGSSDDGSSGDDGSSDGSASGDRSVFGVPIPAEVGLVEDMLDISQFCGDEPITVAYVDSWASVNSWRKITKAELEDEASKCDNIEEILFTDGQGTLEKTISDIQGLIAQDVDVMVVMSDFGNQTLPAMRQAMDAGIAVAAINFANPEGEVGVDYVGFGNRADFFHGRVYTQWLIDNMDSDTCNILHVGGSPGNPISALTYEGIEAAIAENPGCTLLNDGEPLTTNWNPADEQAAVAGALVQFDQIDGIYNECGTCAPGGFQAFVQAGRELPLWASDDVNELGCLFYELEADNPNFEKLSFSAGNYVVRVALRKALAFHNGIENDEPDDWFFGVNEDSTNPDLQPVCVEDAPVSAIWSALLPRDTIIDVVSN